MAFHKFEGAMQTIVSVHENSSNTSLDNSYAVDELEKVQGKRVLADLEYTLKNICSDAVQ